MSAPPRLDPRYRLLDTWRGFACVIVVLHHAGFVFTPADLGGGSRVSAVRQFVCGVYHQLDVGVPLFFVISGYCIAASMDSQRRRGASSWRFLGRRFWRIYPPYWVAVACFAAVVAALRWVGWQPILTGTHSLHLDSPADLSWVQWLGNLSLTETWRPQVLGGGPYLNLTRISWTLCFEEQFYLVSFVLLLACPRRLFGAIAGASALICAWYLMAYDAGWYPKLHGLFPQLWYQFAVGLAVYWRLVLAESSRGGHGVDLALVALAALGWYQGVGHMTVVAVFGLILIALRPYDATMNQWRALAPLRACGHRCYSIYLIHLPICTVGTEALIQLGWRGFWTRALVVSPLVALVGVGAGWLFFALVESRFHTSAPLKRVEPDPSATGPAAGLTTEAGPAGSRLDPLIAV